MTTSGGAQKVRRWLDKLDTALAANADRAGLSNNPSMTGAEREGIFRSALRDFLPPFLSIGEGKIFSIDGGESGQMDVIIHDPRYPVFRQGASALFPIEGVLAAIEIKSRLDTESLLDAWRKCASVANLRQMIAGEDKDRMDKVFEAKGLDQATRLAFIDQHIRPPTYIFAYSGFSGREALAEGLQNVLASDGLPVSSAAKRPAIPSVIASGGAVALAWADPIKMHPPEGALLCPPHQTPVLMTVDTQHGFGILAAQLLWRLEQRAAWSEKRMGVQKSLIDYLPFEEYLAEPVHAGSTLISWDLQDGLIAD